MNEHGGRFMNPDLKPGLYETLINECIEKALKELCEFEAKRKNLDKSESALVLSTYLQSIIKSVLSDFNEDERIARQVELTNKIITTLALETKNEELREHMIPRGTRDSQESRTEILLALRPKTDCPKSARLHLLRILHFSPEPRMSRRSIPR